MSIRKIIFILLAIIMIQPFNYIFSDAAKPVIKVGNKSYSGKTFKLQKGKTYKLGAGKSTTGAITWKSSNKKIINVVKGRLKARKKGSANLVLIIGKNKYRYRCKVTNKSKKDVGVFDLKNGMVLLNSGYKMPVIGLGTWTLSNAEAENSVYHALKSGMRLIDTARYYDCEKGVGRGLKKAINEGIVTRKEVFITSKIMPDDYESPQKGINNSLKDLDVDYVDLMLIHQPGSNDKEVYRALEKAVKEGKIHSIGISNYYTKKQVDKVLSYAKIVPAVIQNENHLFYQNSELKEYVKKYGIVIESWYPFGGRGHTGTHFNNEVIKNVAAAHAKTSAQVILRWQIQAGYIAIPGSSNPDHIAENYDIFDFKLSSDEMNKIYALDKHKRYEDW